MCARDLVEHFYHFMYSLQLDVDFLLHLGMDGQNVNKAFERKLIADLMKQHKNSFLQLESCSLHAMNNAFGKGIKYLKENIIDLDQIAIDLLFFFKYSAERREDYTNVAEVTGITAVYMLKHCTSRWLSIDKVLVRIIKQFPNLNEYF